MSVYYERDGITLIHGDSLEVLPTMEAGSVDLIPADPPYGIDYQSARRTDKSKWKPKITNDGKPFIWWLNHACRVLSDTGSVFCFCRWDVQEAFRLALDWSGLEVKAQVIWDRESHGMGDLNGTPAPQHDVAWFATKSGFKFAGDRAKSIIRALRLGGEELLHPNQKPIELLENIIRHYSASGDFILDPFCGVGTSPLAAWRLGRRALGIEIEEKYCEIAAKRIDAEISRGRLFPPEPEPVEQTSLQWEDQA